MCGLCGGIERERHWTDRLEETDSDADGAAAWRQRRQAQVALANRILCQHGLEVRDWSAHLFVLSNRTGQSELVPQLAAVWSAAERLGRSRCDPLDLALLARLEVEEGVEEGAPTWNITGT
jgi:hypothetical protein